MSIEAIEHHTFSNGSIIARRNMMLGVWAGMRLGLRGDRLSNYAADVMEADFSRAGPDDVIGKIVSDFEENGVDYPYDLVAMELQRIERNVRAELLATD